MNSLDSICIAHKADKGSLSYKHVQGHEVKGHGYARHYDAAFSAIRDKFINLVEIGVGSAESMQSWLEYFPKADVYGLDIVHDTNPWNTPGEKPDPRYTFYYIDQSKEVEWKKFVAKHGMWVDVLIDDGGHASDQIITSFKMMWPHVRAGGFYCIEDLNCAYSGIPYFCPSGWPNQMTFIKDMLDQINRGENQIDRMYYSNELAIIQKKA